MSDYQSLIERVEGLSGGDSEVDCLLHVTLFGWKLTPLGPDYDGGNACEIYTPDGRLMEPSSVYPSRGKVGLYYHVPNVAYTSSIDEALSLVERKLPGRSMLVINSALELLYERGGWRGEDIPKLLPLAILSALLRALQSQEPSP